MPGRQQLFKIDFDMMLKGSICKRGRQTVRQFGVTVGGATRLVTSGDVVDRDMYDALLKAGALRLRSGPAEPDAGDGPLTPDRAGE